MVYPVLQVQVAMLVAASYEIIPLDSGLSVGQGGVGGGGQYWTQTIQSVYSLKVRHILSESSFLLQQCSPSGLKCVGPRCRIMASGLLTALINSSSPVAGLLKTTGTLPPGNTHPTAPLLSLQQYKAGGTLLAPGPKSENEMISPVRSVPEGSLGNASRTVCH